MYNKALFKIEWHSNYKILIVFCLILTMYTTIMISMFDPKLGSALEELSKSMPEIMAMAGMSGATTTLIEFITTYLYGFIMIAFPLIFTILLSLRLIAKKVDNGTMGYLLSSGVERKTVWFSQLCVIGSSILVLIIYCTVLGIVCSQIMFPGELDIKAYLSLNVGVLILHLALSSICYMCSCIFNEYRKTSLFGAGIPIMFILIQMLANMQGSMEGLKYTTMLTLFDAQGIIAGNNEAFLMLGGLLLITFICYIISITIFKQKNMSL